MGLCAGVLTAAGLTLSTAVSAHTPLCSCCDMGDGTVLCEGGFSDGSSAAGVAISVVDGNDNPIIEGELSEYTEYSEFEFDKPSGDYTVVSAFIAAAAATSLAGTAQAYFQLLSDRAPAAGIECEIEYINSDVDMAGNAFSKETKGPVPPTAIATITDANGLFTFGIPRAGTWGFACLGSGPDKEHEGKELSQDAVLWIHAAEL
jgi:hypothetical protein